MHFTSAVTTIRGVGEKTAASFAKMGIYTVKNLLEHFPRTYSLYPSAVSIDEADLALAAQSGERLAIAAYVRRAPVTKSGRRMQVTVLTIGEGAKQLELVWYRMPYIRNAVKTGNFYVFYGKISAKERAFVLEQPAVYAPELYETMAERYFPVYSLTEGITNNLMIKTMQAALDAGELLPDCLPAAVRAANGLCEYNYAIRQIHFPDTMDALITARNRLVFEEFFVFIMGMQYQKANERREKNAFFFQEPEFVDRLAGKLPYTLTGAQRRTIGEIKEQLMGEYVMQRLIQGDVGSGKTVIAFLTMAWASHNGYQSAIMAPTEVLARQHYESFLKMCGDFGLDYPVILLTGSMTARQKRLACERLETEKNALVVGTHALIQERTVYSNLALVITDEQHRFGVRQRDTFAEKGQTPHILVMSATPIPRTLAIILYGDMDISVIDEVPARRLPIKNCVVNTAYRPKAYEFLANQVALGHQAYVICPLVEASENMEGENVSDYAKLLTDKLPGNIRVGILHGKMKNEKKNEVMEQFSANELQVLVSTTVVEVGVNVQNATVMMIENAERFGLAQLHQLRGRVGRGEAQSYCIMVNTSSGEEAKRRLELLNHSNDGFFLASEDLKLRGPGDFFGIRQSGELAFRLADIYQDAGIMQRAAESVREILEGDPGLVMSEHIQLRQKMQDFMQNQAARMNL